MSSANHELTAQAAFTSPLVYVVVVTWNQCRTTIECLESLMQMVYPNFRIVVVDNGSTDGTAEAISNQCPDIEVIANERNLGYPGGCNVGIRYALSQGAEYVFAINNDVFVAPTILDELLHEAAPDVGILAPKIYFAHDPQRIWSVGGCQCPLTLEMKCRGDGELDQGQWNTVLERDYLIGCAHLFSRLFLQEVGLLDAGYFMYYDDLDICIRARRAGYRLLMVPKAHMWHKVATSSGGVDTPMERYYMARGNVRFLRKYVRGWQWLFVVPYRIGSIVKTLLRLALHRRWDSARAYLHGLRDGFRVSTMPREMPLCES
ncbi:MAG: glycosyltransferase family 2 protein [Anaerolineae bacterium]